MIKWIVILVLVSAVAGALGYTGIARAASRGAKILIGLLVASLAAAVLIIAADSTAPRVASAASIALWAVCVALSWTSVGLAAILALSTSAVLVGTAHRRQRR